MWKLLLAAAWIAYGPTGPIARTIVKTDDCPSIVIDGTPSKMRVHAAKSTDYPVTVCEAGIAPHVKSASIDGEELPLKKLNRAEKVAIVGDTGCRMRTAKGQYPAQNQGCVPATWPFQEVAGTIAKWDPDVILHVGDYYYREAACKGTNCVPAKYNWNRWNVDFFAPAAKLLPHAPWIFVRGNHEMCSRAAEGWVRFLDPRSYLWENVQTCTSNLTYTPPYVVSLGALDVAVVDSSAADDALDQAQVPIYAGQLALLRKTRPGTWLTQHHPYWAASGSEEDSDTMAAAWEQSPLPQMAGVFTGHIHLLEILNFTNNEVPQFVIGNGGTALDAPATDPTGTSLSDRTVKAFYQDDDFGFIAATRVEGGGWKFDVVDKQGKVKFTTTSSP
jgi:hypothetical protein